MGRPAAGAPAADERVDAGGRAVIPGFVDSHTHLVFAGDRAAEFAARMAGEAYTGGGIATTVAATRAASDERLRANAARRLARDALASGTTTVEIKSGYGLTVADEARLLRDRRRVHRRDDLPRRARRAAPSTRTTAPATSRSSRGEMLAACAPLARWIDVFCDTGAFDEDEARTVLRAGIAAGTPAAAARQPARARVRACGSRSRSARRASTTARTSPTTTSRRSPASSTVATLLPAAEFGTRAPLPGRAAPARRGRHRRARDRLQPGHVVT